MLDTQGRRQVAAGGESFISYVPNYVLSTMGGISCMKDGFRTYKVECKPRLMVDRSEPWILELAVERRRS